MDVMESLEILWELNTPFGNLEKATAGGASASDEGEPHPKAKAKKAQELKSIHEFAREMHGTPSPAHSSSIPFLS